MILFDLRCESGHTFEAWFRDGEAYETQVTAGEVVCPVCGEEFLGTRRHAGGFIAGHRAYHEFEREQDMRIEQMGGI